ncbi:hypothetical protein SAMN05216559_3683 [Halomicrobium zhouii]|uniref:Uncharacterized protein n=1 Tax=Halomicrobium zhouii TaxID=767519 RepID=A0A1I6M3B2_9EURY|nr:hypothetical protein [Halomicrobium zhouii]SFS10217.1 hypothetical protein SAMN05216559_3683 [Halomicrobium zhouii]
MTELLSRILVTWIELTVVGTVGGLVGTTLGGPPGFIVYLGTTLLSVGVLLYNVDQLVAARVDGTQRTERPGTPEDRSP